MFQHMMSLAFKIPELIGATYCLLVTIKNGENMFVDDQLVRSLYFIQVVVLLFLPAIYAGLLAAKADKLKITLYEKLIKERDEEHARFLDCFISYVSARPLKIKMMKVVPLDWTLPILVLDLIISYQIVIVQFTHIF
ncbi:unnamed protein product [Diatraea saccharalis]|uniref:Uncharacterized protein n=1 Tax=Diatraea saccharalis TaxID=40085 RepID=A0A9N9RBS3_9NEOP|nr:unnamed protein product [Diatraea saccharalis]